MKVARVKILRIIARMNIGGPAVQITTLMQELPDGEFQQLLIYGKCNSNEIDYLECHQIRVPSIQVNSLGRSISIIHDVKAILAIWRTIIRFKPDIVHTHTFKAGLLGRLATVPLLKRPTVMHTYHGHLLYGYFGKFKTRVIVLLEKYLASISDVLVAVGENVQRDLLASGIGTPSKYRVIRPGFTLRKTQELNRFELGIEQSDFVCCWVGRLTGIKRPDRILDLAQEFKDRKIDKLKFIVIGDGEQREDLERQAISRSLPIIFLGWRTNSIDYIALSNLLVLTSENEGTPIAVIEAQLLGKPVIATNVGSVSEVMIPGKTGFLLDYDNKIFCSKIIQLRDNPAQYDMFSSRAKEFAALEFSNEKFISNYKSLYKESLNL